MKLKFLILVLGLQTAWLLGTVAVQEHALATGRVIRLETQPVDPRDLLSGDYLMLRYKISDVPANLFSPPVEPNLPYGRKIFVALVPGTNGFYTVSRASTNAFVPAANEILLKGQSAGRWWNATNSVHVAYGIERYYVAENTGNPPHGRLTVQVVVPASGRARLQQVFLDGQPYEQALKAAAP
ncbi:MAG TPA: GDYXXLXY domain-containing protein [Verrucomicrobiae bacterium]|nr:GDYXXLXY domain-containing protein [Verrucomicrobiae bacterium]